MVVADQYTIRSENLVRYTFGPDGAFGNLITDGRGYLTGRIGEGAAAKDIRLDWNAMRMDPHPTVRDKLVLTLSDGIVAQMTDFGTMTAQQLELYCVVLSGGHMGNLMLDEITVRNNVVFETASGVCRVNQLSIFFVNVLADGREIRASRMPQAFAHINTPRSGVSEILQVQHLQPLTPQSSVVHPISQPAAPQIAAPVRAVNPLRPAQRNTIGAQNLMGISSSPSGGQFEITGNQMRMLVRLQQGQSSAEIVILEGNVRLKENVASNVPNEAIEILGDNVVIWDPADLTTKIRITGRTTGNDAIIKGRGVEMRAKQLELSRACNRFWVDGPGQLIAHTAQMNAPGIPSSRGSDGILQVDWNQGMASDGRVVQFSGVPDELGNRVNVLYRTADLRTELRCNIMEIRLVRQVMFFDSNAAPEPEGILFRGDGLFDVNIRNQQFDAQGKQKSQGFVSVARLDYDVKRNHLVAHGPGEMTLVFLGSSQGFGSNILAGVPATSAETLNLLSVWFSRTMQGTLLGGNAKLEITCQKVEVAFCPANSWQDRIGRQNISAARHRGYILECERLVIEEIPNPANPSESFFELLAEHSALIDGSGLFARARRIGYSQARSTVDLNGNVSIEKRLQGQARPISGGGERIVYDIQAGRFEIIESRTGIGF